MNFVPADGGVLTVRRAHWASTFPARLLTRNFNAETPVHQGRINKIKALNYFNREN